MAEAEAQNSDEESDNEGVPVFLNLQPGDQLAAMFDDSDDEDGPPFEGFMGDRYPDVPLSNWQRAELDFPQHPWDERAGPTLQQAPGENALAYFALFFDDPFLERVRQWTNLNAENKRRDNPNRHRTPWEPIEAIDELKAFFAVILFTEMYFSGRYEELWSSTRDHHLLQFPGITRVFPRDRFTGILRYLHFTREWIARGNRQNPGFDKLYKVRPLLNHLRDRFLAEYTPDRNISIDECMIPFKGRLGFKQYHRDKVIIAIVFVIVIQFSSKNGSEYASGNT